MHRRSTVLCISIMLMGFLQSILASPPVDPEVRAHLEAKVMSEMSLKELEELVENDERVRNAPKSKIVIVPKAKSSLALDGEAYVIHRKQSKAPKKYQAPKYPGEDYEDGFRRSSFEPDYRFESKLRYDEGPFPSLFSISDMETAASDNVKRFYDSIVESVLGKQKFGLANDPMALLELAASEHVPAYEPRFDYDSYSKDSTETKLKGKNYWKEAPERREEKVDENGCRTVVKKIMDPEDEKKSSSAKAKSVIITKECEYPSIDGPDAKIPEIQSNLGARTSRLDSQAFPNYEDNPSSYESTRPADLRFGNTEAKDPLAPDYIDKMLETHFRSFPGFRNPITSFKGYQERFNLRTPEAFKEVKPKVGVQTYEYTHPESGFSEEEGRAPAPGHETTRAETPRVYEHHYHYDYPQKASTKKATAYDDEREPIVEAKSANPKDPKMVKKSFAYYRKDNPKEDPNDHQYAEEYAQGNYRSFSSDYDSDRDGPKKA